uniref:hypothetical protein n=1 Tax=Psychromonas sp. TaxID=1884585 RepID=UPI003A96C48C
MSIIVSLWIYLTIMTLSFLMFKIFKVKIFGVGSHPIGLFILVQFFVFSLPGVLLVSFGGFESSRYAGISVGKLQEIGFWYLYSYFVFIICICVFYKLGGVKNYKNYLGEKNKIDVEKQVAILLFLSAIIFIVKLIILGETPLILALRGEVYRANILRTEFQNNLSANQIPYVEPLFD